MKTKLIILTAIIFTSIASGQVTRDIDEENVPVIRSIDITEKTVTDDEDVSVPFAVLEDAPNFETCKEFTYQEAKECFHIEMNKHIKKYFTYPKEAKEANVQGRVIVMFIINKTGELEQISVKGTRKEGSEFLEKEALRIVNLLPKFIPGKQRGRRVNVSYALPIIFKLDEKSENKE